MTKKKNQKSFLSILLILIISIYGIYMDEINQTFGLENTTSTFQEVDSSLQVSYLDVGQADSILIQNKDESMLIDAGNNEDGPLLVKYFNEKNITNFKYVIGTHPHEDHIGGLDDIINHFPISKIYMPDAITTTKTFTDVLDALETNNLTYTIPKIGETLTLGDATIKVIFTGTDTSDLNNTSIILKLTFGSTSFLFTGDATSKTEKEILNQDITADVLKVGHHGSEYSSSNDFLDQVNPQYAIISVGKNNSYHHPSNSTINKLEKRNIETYRTDQKGTIIVTSDGQKITITNQTTNTNGG